MKNRSKDFLDKPSRLLVKEHGEFFTADEAKAGEAAANKDGQQSQDGHSLPATKILAPLSR